MQSQENRTARLFPLLLLALLGACARGGDHDAVVAVPVVPKALPAATAPPLDPKAVEARLQQCRAALEAAIAPGFLTNASFDNGRPILWVGPAWKQATPAIRHALARNAACFFRSGDESQPIRYSVYDNASDREVAVWDFTHLLIL